jgi:hypothetical protein
VSTKSEAKSSHDGKAGRPRGSVPRPHIEIPGDVLIPKSEAAAELGVAPRTITRMQVPSTLIGGVCYVPRGRIREMLADSLSSPKKRRGARR